MKYAYTLSLTFYEKELQNTSQTEFRDGKLIKKLISYVLSGKIIIVILIAGLIQGYHCIKSVIIQNKTELGLHNFATKSDGQKES